MSILERIEKDLTQALKEKKEGELLILRLLKTGLKNAEIAKRPGNLTPEDEIRVLQNESKKHLDSIEMFTRGNREDLVLREKRELEVIKRYLPEEMSDEKLQSIVKRVISAMGEEREYGKIMRAVMKEVAGRADGKRAGEIVKKLV